MQFIRKIAIVMVSIILPYMCAVLVLVHYMRGHPGPIPRWISLPMFALFIAVCALVALAISRAAREQVAVETIIEADSRRSYASKGLKAGLILYALILLNGIRLVLQGDVSWWYAIPGLAIDVFLISVTWVSLRRLKQHKPSDVPETKH